MVSALESNGGLTSFLDGMGDIVDEFDLDRGVLVCGVT